MHSRDGVQGKGRRLSPSSSSCLARPRRSPTLSFPHTRTLARTRSHLPYPHLFMFPTHIFVQTRAICNQLERLKTDASVGFFNNLERPKISLKVHDTDPHPQLAKPASQNSARSFSAPHEHARDHDVKSAPPRSRVSAVHARAPASGGGV